MRYKNWACDIPDLDPRGFRPMAGKMRLYGGDGGGGGGDGGGNDAYGGSGDLAGALGGGSFSDAGAADTGGISAADINAAINAAVEAAATNAPAAATETADFSTDPFGALDALAGKSISEAATETADFSTDPFGALDALAEANLPGTSSTPSGYGISEGIPGLGVSAPSNVVSSPVSGGWTDASGQGIVSQGMNISLGLDPTHGPIGAFAGTNPNAPNQAAIDVAATLLGVTPQDLLGASAKDYGFLGESKPDISVAGLDRGTLEAMSAAGYGGLDITGNQTVDQALAAFNTRDAMSEAFPGLANALVPGFGTLSSVSKALVGLHQGYLTPGQALAQAGLGIAGIPVGTANKGLEALGLGPSVVGPTLESVGVVSPSAEPSGTAGGDTGGGASTTAPTETTTTTTSTLPSTNGNSANALGLLALLSGNQNRNEAETQNVADVRRGVAMSPFGLPYGG